VVAVAVVDRCVAGEAVAGVHSVFVDRETEGEPVLLLSFADPSDHEPHVLAALGKLTAAINIVHMSVKYSTCLPRRLRPPQT